MSDKCSFRDLPPKTAIELIKEAEEKQKKHGEKKHSTGTEFLEDHVR